MEEDEEVITFTYRRKLKQRVRQNLRAADDTALSIGTRAAYKRRADELSRTLARVQEQFLRTGREPLWPTGEKVMSETVRKHEVEEGTRRTSANFWRAEE
jgi:hypothetical protein